MALLGVRLIAVAVLLSAGVRAQAADETIGGVGETEPARVRLVEEEIRVAIPQGHVEVAAVPGEV